MFAAIDGGFAKGEEVGVIEGVSQPVILWNLAEGAHVIAHVGFMEDGGKVHSAGFPVVGGLGHVEAFRVAYHVLDGSEPALRHDFTEFLSDEAHEVYHVFGLAREVFAQFGVLGCDAHRAGVFLADAHHQAAHGH